MHLVRNKPKPHGFLILTRNLIFVTILVFKLVLVLHARAGILSYFVPRQMKKKIQKSA
jgi:hypothetical protein